MADAVGAFIISAALITLCGVTGWFERVMDRLSLPLANALLAGVLARFALDAFLALQSAFALVLAMLLGYLVARRWWPRYAVVTVLAVGTAFALAAGRLHVGAIDWHLTLAGLRRAGVLVARRDRPRAAALRRHDGVAEPARRRGLPRRRLSPAGVRGHHDDRRRDLAAGAVRRVLAEPRGDHRGDLHGPRGARGPGAALHGRRRQRRAVLRDRPVRRRGDRRADRVPARARDRAGRPGAARQHRQRPGRRGARRRAARGRADHLPRHA